jgi:hypothetical protein
MSNLPLLLNFFHSFFGIIEFSVRVRHCSNGEWHIKFMTSLELFSGTNTNIIDAPESVMKKERFLTFPPVWVGI